MRIVRYIDVYAGIDPDSVFFKNRQGAISSPKGSGCDRYRIEFEVPDPEPKDVTARVGEINIEEVDE